MTTFAKIFYRPTENHVGVIYSRWGKFKRFAQPNKWTLLSSSFEFVAKEIRLDMRTAKVALGNVLTRDRVAIDLEMKIFYSVDVREAIEQRKLQILRFENESAWEEIVKTGITDIARNVIIISRTFDELVTEAGRSYLKQALSSALAHRVRGFGILMNRFAVNIMNLQPNAAFQQALQDDSAAKTLGSAAADRIRPLFEQFSDQDQQKAFLTLMLNIAAAVAKNGQSPDLVFPNTNDFLSGREVVGNGHNSISPNIQRISQPRMPRSVAGD
jgi:regulator of protease activity HflC (stomatin/prohibitin superfamily)